MSAQPATIVFAFSDTGGGHRSAALAIQAALQTTAPIPPCPMLDILRLSNVPLVRDAPTLYDTLSTRWLHFYNICFRITDSPWRVNMLTNITLPWAKRHIQQPLSSIKPQLVVCTHPLVPRLVCAARQTFQEPFRIVTVVTDLVSLHGSWVYQGVDRYLLPTQEAYDVVTRRGISPERIQRTGFPVHPKFAACTDTKHAARRKLGIAEAQWTLLITSGGVGSGQLINPLVVELESAFPDVQLLVVTGKNQARYTQLRSQSRSLLTHIYGFVDHMELLMAASDVVITKAGPGTLMEALVMRRPVIITEAVGMQEHGNIDFVLNHQFGFFCPTIAHIKQTIAMLQQPASYAQVAARLLQAVPSDGAAQIAALLLEELVLVGSY